MFRTWISHNAMLIYNSIPSLTPTIEISTFACFIISKSNEEQSFFYFYNPSEYPTVSYFLLDIHVDKTVQN